MSWPSSKERSGYWLGVAENIRDFLTYWICDDQSKQVLARSVVRPYNRNRCVRWDPSFSKSTVRNTAHIGGDIRPSNQEIEKYLSNVEDQYDLEVPEPEPRFFQL